MRFCPECKKPYSDQHFLCPECSNPPKNKDKLFVFREDYEENKRKRDLEKKE